MKKTLLITLPIVILLLAASGYLFGLPALQMNGYQPTAKANQATLHGSARKAMDAANQKAYFDEDVTLAEAKNALKISKATTADLASKLESSEKSLTDLSELPYVSSVNSGYKTVLDVKSLEAEYIQASKDYLAEVQAVTKYNEQTLPALEKTEQIKAIVGKMQNAASPDEAASLIGQLISVSNEAIKIYETTKPADSVKELHEFDLKGTKELVALMGQLKSALVAQNVEQFMTLSEVYDKKSTAYGKESHRLSVKSIKDSRLSRLGDRVNQLNGQIASKTTNW